MNTLAELSIIRASDEHCFNCAKYWETNNGRGNAARCRSNKYKETSQIKTSMTIVLQRENSSNLKITGFEKYSVAFLLSRIFIKLYLKIHLLCSTYTQYHRNLLIKLVYTQNPFIQTSVIRNERSQWIDSRRINDWTRAVQSSINSWLPVERVKTNGIGPFDSLKHLDNTLRSCDHSRRLRGNLDVYYEPFHTIHPTICQDRGIDFAGGTSQAPCSRGLLRFAPLRPQENWIPARQRARKLGLNRCGPRPRPRSLMNRAASNIKGTSANLFDPSRDIFKHQRGMEEQLQPWRPPF